MTTKSRDTELRGLLKLALEHSRRSNPTAWIGLEIGDVRVNVSIRRTFATQIHVFLVARTGRPSQAQVEYVVTQLGLRPYKQEEIPLFGRDIAYYFVSDHYDLRDTDPRPSPV